MATILQFPTDVASWRAPQFFEDDQPRGEILLFTGVRYERDDSDEQLALDEPANKECES